MINIILLLGTTCILATGALWYLDVARNRPIGVVHCDHEKQVAGYSTKLVAASETASHAVLSLGQLIESRSSLLSQSLGDVTPELINVLDARLGGVLKANIELQERLLSAEAVIRKQQADIDRARREACTDLLTGLPNRRGLQDSLQAALHGSSRGDEGCLYFLMMDLDHFKRVNDTLGHPAGDRVLKAVANSLQRSLIAAGGSVARFGGEEFAGFLRCRTQDELALFSQNLLADVRAAGSASLGSKQVVTISVGAAAWKDAESVESLVGRADLALYGAKQHGRNCAYYHNGRRVVPLSHNKKTDSLDVPSSRPSADRRQAERCVLQSVQRVAFLTENVAEFHDVTCLDVSTNGLAFLSNSRPESSDLLVDFSAQQGPTIFSHVVSCQRAVDGLWRVACRFVHRVRPGESLGDFVGQHA